MPTVTPNYGWPVPLSTDYVKDGATAIEALGDAIDATVFGLGSGMKLINSSTFSGAVSYSFGSDASPIFTSTYRNYRIVIDNLFTASSEQEILFRFRANTTDFTGTNYFYQRGSFVDAGSSAANSTSQTSYRIGSATNDGSTQVIIDICNPQTTSRTTAFAVCPQWTGGRFVFASYAGTVTNTSQYNGFTFFAGQNLSGNITTYGLAK
jgi:hypothetical protein